MTLGSFVHRALAHLSPADLDRMLELNETLLVEHKGDLGELTNCGLAKAISAFAQIQTLSAQDIDAFEPAADAFVRLRWSTRWARTSAPRSASVARVTSNS